MDEFESPQQEFNPESAEDRADKNRLISWLNANGARLDPSESGGNVAKKLVVHDQAKGGVWEVPITAGIDAVDEADAKHMAEATPTFRLTQLNDTEGEEPKTEVELLWTGTDGTLRTNYVTDGEFTFVADAA